jgi:hypothetical protein
MIGRLPDSNPSHPSRPRAATISPPGRSRLGCVVTRGSSRPEGDDAKLNSPHLRGSAIGLRGACPGVIASWLWKTPIASRAGDSDPVRGGVWRARVHGSRHSPVLAGSRASASPSDSGTRCHRSCRDLPPLAGAGVNLRDRPLEIVQVGLMVKDGDFPKVPVRSGPHVSACVDRETGRITWPGGADPALDGSTSESAPAPGRDKTAPPDDPARRRSALPARCPFGVQTHSNWTQFLECGRLGRYPRTR